MMKTRAGTEASQMIKDSQSTIAVKEQQQSKEPEHRKWDVAEMTFEKERKLPNNKNIDRETMRFLLAEGITDPATIKRMQESTYDSSDYSLHALIMIEIEREYTRVRNRLIGQIEEMIKDLEDWKKTTAIIKKPFKKIHDYQIRMYHEKAMALVLLSSDLTQEYADEEEKKTEEERKSDAKRPKERTRSMLISVLTKMKSDVREPELMLETFSGGNNASAPHRADESAPMYDEKTKHIEFPSMSLYDGNSKKALESSNPPYRAETQLGKRGKPQIMEAAMEGFLMAQVARSDDLLVSARVQVLIIPKYDTMETERIMNHCQVLLCFKKGSKIFTNPSKSSALDRVLAEKRYSRREVGKPGTPFETLVMYPDPVRTILEMNDSKEQLRRNTYVADIQEHPHWKEAQKCKGNGRRYMENLRHIEERAKGARIAGTERKGWMRRIHHDIPKVPDHRAAVKAASQEERTQGRALDVTKLRPGTVTTNIGTQNRRIPERIDQVILEARARRKQEIEKQKARETDRKQQQQAIGSPRRKQIYDAGIELMRENGERSADMLLGGEEDSPRTPDTLSMEIISITTNNNDARNEDAER